MKTLKKRKVIIDTDPGVDDTTGIIFALFDDALDIKLFTIPPGNVSSQIATRNLCHILDLFEKDYPVAKGPKTAMKRVSPDAAWLHGKEGLGGYIPPKRAKHKILKDDAAEAMYKIIKENPHEITILAFGPHTNIGILLERHPDCENLIKQIIFEGAAPFGLPNDPNYISFNARTDPESLKIVLESKIPIVMVTSDMGRFVTHLTEEMVKSLPEINDVGKFIAKTYEIYWEPNAPSKRIATNDSCALFYISNPKIYTCKRCTVNVNITDNPGSMKVQFNPKGNVLVTENIDREKFLNIYFDRLKKLNNIKITEKLHKSRKKSGT